MTEKDPADVDAGLSFIPDCDEVQPTVLDGYHYPGEDCLRCHRQGGEGPPMSMGGTAYADFAGSAPVVGMTIHMVDASGSDFTAVTTQNGNFYSFDSMSFPVTAFASLCPDVAPMIAPIAEVDGDCNRGGCHAAGFRVAIP